MKTAFYFEVSFMRILLADNQAKVRFALRVLLERQAGFEVVTEVSNVQDLLVRTATECLDLVLLDWELAGPAAAGLLLALRNERPDLVVIALSGRLEARRAALAAGADAFVSKGDPPERLLETIARCCPHRQADALASNGLDAMTLGNDSLAA
jgi:DNA-binding NarL/FixJ family response regulator